MDAKESNRLKDFCIDFSEPSKINVNACKCGVHESRLFLANQGMALGSLFCERHDLIRVKVIVAERGKN